jgi:hypothetical protein
MKITHNCRRRRGNFFAIRFRRGGRFSFLLSRVRQKANAMVSLIGQIGIFFIECILDGVNIFI